MTAQSYATRSYRQQQFFGGYYGRPISRRREESHGICRCCESAARRDAARCMRGIYPEAADLPSRISDGGRTFEV
jgi:hypothetical protein